MSTATPIYRDTRALAGVLLQTLAGSDRYASLCNRIETTALQLLDEVSLALGGFDTVVAIERADMTLRCLRSQLLLAYELEILAEDDFEDFAEGTNAIGRQLGGWLKKLA
ncbi:MAG: four helix bundle protein [Pseudomonadota bacterium]